MAIFFKFALSSILLSGLGLGEFIDFNENGIDNVKQTGPHQSVMIAGGGETTRYEFPWQIRIQWKINKTLICGGTIIDNSTILTAAHCISDPELDAQRFMVLAGAHNMNMAEDDSRQRMNISKIICHADWNRETWTWHNDICIVKLESTLIWTIAVKPIPLADREPMIPGTGVVTGWGLLSEEGIRSPVLRKVTLPLVSHTDCARIYGPVEITGSMFCAGGVEGKGWCQGDSGGPFICSLQEKPFLCGVISFGVGCARPGIPGVYTQVSSYRKWIEENSVENVTDGSSVSLPSAFILFFLIVVNVIVAELKQKI